ncbi:ABC transporter permease [Verrucomicrobia bacterium]|nr:ABC transporter permease [Verrucomicrobiota bacterium]
MNGFMELIRQPIYLVIMVSSNVFMLFLASLYYAGAGEDTSMVQGGILATIFLSGIFTAVLGASLSIGEEIESGTALTVLSKPVGRVTFILAKFAALASSLVLQCFTGCLAALLSSRMAFDVYGAPDYPAIVIYGAGIALACIIGLCLNFFAMKPFVGPTVISMLFCMTIAFIAANYVDRDWSHQSFGKDVDWRMLQAVLLLLFALCALAGFAIACSTRASLIPTLILCLVVFLSGLVSDYFLGTRAEEGVFWAKCLYAITPNWQLFWMSDALANDKSIPLTYVLRCGQYAAGTLAISLGMAVLLFEDRELS